MTTPLERRIARLEALRPPKSDKIAVFVWREDEVPKKIEEMIAAGEIAEADRHRCAWWLDIKHEVEWLRQWEDEELLAADAARQKAKQEQAEKEKAERDKAEKKTGEPDDAGQPRTEQDAERQNAEQQESPQSEAGVSRATATRATAARATATRATATRDGIRIAGCRRRHDTA
jgi:hypothetical protein